MDVYEPMHQFSMWGGDFKGNIYQDATPANMILEVDPNQVHISNIF